MNILKEEIRPKLQELGEILAEEIKKKQKINLFPHVAKHARRTVNLPEETWVAFSSSKLGYKKLLHFEVGLNRSNLYVKLVLKAECESKRDFASKLGQELSLLDPLRKASYLIYGVDINASQGRLLKEVGQEEIEGLLEGLQTKKNSWLAVGLEFSKEQMDSLEKSELIKKIIMAINKLYPLYDFTVR